MRIEHLLNKRLVFVDGEQTMAEVVRIMRDQHVSSVLVLNRERWVVGIVTERDIVHKFTLLDKDEKLDAKVLAFMTRPVLFARLGHLEEDVRTMFFERRLRHFPVSEGSLQEQDIIGMLTVTDLTRAYLRRPQAVQPRREPVVIIAADDAARSRYRRLFEALHHEPISGEQTAPLLKEAIARRYPIVYDMDKIPLETAKADLRSLKDYTGSFVLLSSSDKLVESLQKSLDSAQHFVALKPLDISYILRLIEPKADD